LLTKKLKDGISTSYSDIFLKSEDKENERDLNENVVFALLILRAGFLDSIRQ
jgi:hypothetical protein